MILIKIKTVSYSNNKEIFLILEKLKSLIKVNLRQKTKKIKDSKPRLKIMFQISFQLLVLDYHNHINSFLIKLKNKKGELTFLHSKPKKILLFLIQWFQRLKIIKLFNRIILELDQV